VSDIMVPGITNSGVNTDGLIEDLMEAERAPITRMEERIDSYEQERSAWQELGRKVTNLQEAARLLYGFENPFNERIASSSDESVLIATAERNADEGVARLSVEQLAEADRFISRDLPSDFDVPAGRYGFRVGENEEFFTYSGGSLRNFAQTINRRAADVVNARVVQNTANSQIILIEALEPGEANQLSFLEDSRAFGIEAGILEEVVEQTLSTPIQASTVTNFQDPAAGRLRSVQAGTLTVEPGGEALVRFPAAVNDVSALVMELEVSVTNLWSGWSPPETPPGPVLPDPGSITLGDITIENDPSQVPLPEWDSPEPPEIRDDLRVLSLRDGSQVVSLPDLSDTDGFVTLQVPLSEYVDGVDGLVVDNNNTHREIRVRNISVYDTTTRGDITPVNPLSTARDAQLTFEGIRVIRPSNVIDDLVDGVTLELRGASTRDVQLTVEPDREAVTDSLIQFVFYYNELMREINILTRTDRAVVDEITNYTPEERETALERLGLLQGDLILNRIRSTLQTIMMNAYPTDAGSELTLLAQMGISTNASGPGGGFDASRLRGYLEMNPRELESILRTHFEASRQLFGSDSDGDLTTDTGVAFELQRNLRPMTQTGGTIAIRTGTINTSISQTEDRIGREESRLEQAEADYRAQFAQMEAAMARMEQMQTRLQALQPQQRGNQ
jgi:flagellar hook-associated protein 2